MSQHLTFEQWKEQVLEGIKPHASLLTLDDELLFMAYDMEGISVEQAIEEYMTSVKRIVENKH